MECVQGLSLNCCPQGAVPEKGPPEGQAKV